MLVLRCASCGRKLWRYDKIGPGELLRCHKDRIDRFYQAVEKNGRILCSCGRSVGIDKGSFYKMIAKGFTYRGTKRNR